MNQMAAIRIYNNQVLAQNAQKNNLNNGNEDALSKIKNAVASFSYQRNEESPTAYWKRNNTDILMMETTNSNYYYN